MYVTYCIYNNEPTIRKSLESILPYVEKVIAVDGAYANFPHKEPQSTDGTKEIFHELCGDKLIWVGCGGKPWPTQIGKRNEYVKRVPEGMWFLILDGDGVVKGEIKEGFKRAESSKHICIGVKNINYQPIWDGSYTNSGMHVYANIPRNAWNNLEWMESQGVASRLYRKTGNMKYEKKHSTIYVDNLMVSRVQTVIETVFIVNLNKEMGWERWQANLEYKTKNPIH